MDQTKICEHICVYIYVYTYKCMHIYFIMIFGVVLHNIIHMYIQLGGTSEINHPVYNVMKYYPRGHYKIHQYQLSVKFLQQPPLKKTTKIEMQIFV